MAKKKKQAEGAEADLLTRKPDEGIGPTGLVASSPTQECPTMLEYVPAGGTAKWRVEKFDLLSVEMGMGTGEGWDVLMGRFHFVASEYSRSWAMARRLFGVGPVILPGDARPEDFEPQSREQVCELMGIDKEQLGAELDVLRNAWRGEMQQESEAQEEEEEKEQKAEKAELTFGHEVLGAYGFSEKMFKVTSWDPEREASVPRSDEENRKERDWFALRVKEWEKMLREPFSRSLCEEALLNELYLRRMRTEMAVVTPSSTKFKELRSMRGEIEAAYGDQLERLQEMFPEMNIAGKMTFHGTMSDIIKGYRDYKARGDTVQLDRIRTAGEIEVEMRQSVQAPEARYRFGLNIMILEAMHNLYDPNFRSQFRHETLKKLDAGFKRAVEEVRAANGEKLVDLMKGVMPGEGGDEYEDIPEVGELG